MKSVRVDRITLLTKEDLARKLRVSVWTLQSYIKRGLMPRPFSLVAGGEQKWRASDIETWLDDLQAHPKKQKLRGALKCWPIALRPFGLGRHVHDEEAHALALGLTL